MKEMLAERETARLGFRSGVHRELHRWKRSVFEHLRPPWDVILRGSGLTREQIRAAAEIAMKCKRIIVAGRWA